MTNTKKEISKWAVYWLLIVALYIALSLIFGNFELYALILGVAAINFIVRLAIIYPFKKLSIKWLKCAIIIILNVLIIGAFVFFGYIVLISGTYYNNKYIDSLDYSIFHHTSNYSYDEKTGVYILSSQNDECKILQLTDIHICASVNTISTDRKAFEACYKLIKETQPDLIIVTGDMVYPIPVQTFSSNNLIPMWQFCRFMNNVGIPWAMVYGNHDTEESATHNEQSFSDIYAYYKANKSSMLYADKQPDIYGRYNQYIRVENNNGSLNRILFLIDSNDYVQNSVSINEYDSVHEDQIQWYADTIDKLSAENNSAVKSFVYMHIPFQAFAEAQAALENNSSDAQYLFGANGESVSCPDKDTGFFEKILEKKSTEAVFVGHDHLNNLGVKYKGVDLVYSKSIDYVAYPKIAQQSAQRGATLATLYESGEYKITQIDLS